MADAELVAFSNIQLRPDPSRTVIRPFNIEYPGAFKVEGHPRAVRVIDRVLSLSPDELRAERRRVMESLDERTAMSTSFSCTASARSWGCSKTSERSTPTRSC